ncbi:MAG UNVERIFIED_CONTAM: hypothetical protein LVT10_21635 [Anaerolineae bacterium]|jgi:tyrosyl-tRNA synthetase
MAKDLKERSMGKAEKEGLALCSVHRGYDPRSHRSSSGAHHHHAQIAPISRFGHDVTFLIGTFTSLIGDPSDKDKARDQLTPEQVDINAQTYAEQAFEILDSSGLPNVRRNDEWLSSVGFRRHHSSCQQFHGATIPCAREFC